MSECSVFLICAIFFCYKLVVSRRVLFPPPPPPLKPAVVIVNAGSRSCGLVPISAVYYRYLNLEAVWLFVIIIIIVIIVVDSKQIVNIGSVRHNPELVTVRRML
jgi:hypothetical protein